MPAPYATVEQVRTFYAGVDAEALKVEVARNAAARIVARHAPAPDPEGTVYPGLARDAELIVGEYLWTTRGFTKSSGVEGITESYADVPAVVALVEQVMGPYVASVAPPAQTGSAYTLGVASSFSE